MTNNNKSKRYYWIKIKDSFLTSDKVDFLMSQPNGANYIVIYQMLCLRTINTGGELSRTIGEIIIPFDEEKIQRDLKYFNIDTIRVALELYKKLGMIYEQDNGILKITDFDTMVGSETQGAIEKRNQRELSKSEEIDKGIYNVYQDIRDKRLDIRDKDINNNSSVINNTCVFDAQNLEIFNHWNSKNIIVHDKFNEKIDKAITKAIKTYGVDNIKLAIDRYDTALKDTSYFFYYKWSLETFLKQKNSLPDFLDNGAKWLDYQSRKQKSNMPNNTEFLKDFIGE